MNIYAQIFGTIAVLLMFTSYLKTSKKEYLFFDIVTFLLNLLCIELKLDNILSE